MYISFKSATHSKFLHISVAEKKEPTFLIAYAEIIIGLYYPSTVTKVDWMWDNYVHSSSYGAFLFFVQNAENRAIRWWEKKFSPKFKFSRKYMARRKFE